MAFNALLLVDFIRGPIYIPLPINTNFSLLDSVSDYLLSWTLSAYLHIFYLLLTIIPFFFLFSFTYTSFSLPSFHIFSNTVN
jgi:hypothetical protein